MWYFAWLLGLPLAAAFGVLNAMWYELMDDAAVATAAVATAAVAAAARQKQAAALPEPAPDATRRRA